MLLLNEKACGFQVLDPGGINSSSANSCMPLMGGMSRWLGLVLLLWSAGFRAEAQEFQSQFASKKVDRSKAPSTFHDLASVEVATGAVNIQLPLGPGIGNNRLRYTPTLRARFAPQNRVIPKTIYVPSNTGIAPVSVDEVQGGSMGGFALEPGKLIFAQMTGFPGNANETSITGDVYSESRSNPLYSHFELPSGGGGSFVRTTIADGLTLPSITDVQPLLAVFGFGSGWEVCGATVANNTVVGGGVITRNTDGSISIPLYHPTECPPVQYNKSKFVGAVYPAPTPVVSYLPARYLIVSGTDAVEYTYAAISVTRLVGQGPGSPTEAYSEPLPSPHGPNGTHMMANPHPLWDQAKAACYRTSRWLSRTHGAEFIRFIPLANTTGAGIVGMSGYRAEWVVDGAVCASVTVAPKTAGSASSNGWVEANLSDMDWKVTYQAGDANGGTLPSFTLGHCLIDNLEWQNRSSLDFILPASEGGGSAVLPGFESLWVSSVKEDWTPGETITFAKGGLGSSSNVPVWSGSSVPFNALTSIASSGRTMSLDWKCYEIALNSSDQECTAVGGYLSDHDPLRTVTPMTWAPAWQAGVTQVTETDTAVSGSLGVRKTSYVRSVPTPNRTGATPSPIWNTTNFSTTVTHPDGTKTKHVFASPLTSVIANPTTQDYLKSLAYLKHLEVRTEITAPGKTSAHLVTMHQNLDCRTASNPNGDHRLRPTPYFLSTRSWDALTGVRSSEALSAWDGKGWGQTTKGWRTEAVPTSGFGSDALTEAESTLLTHTSWSASYWIPPQVATRQQTRQVGATTTQGPLVTLTGDSAIQGFFRLKTVTEAVGSDIRTTAFTYKGDSGINAALLDTAKVTQNGTTSGVASYGYDSRGILNAIQPLGASWTLGQTVDGLGRVIAQTDADGRVTTLTPDPAGRIASITPPAGEATTFVAVDGDLRGLTLTRGDQVSGTRFNAFGQKVSEWRKDPNGVKTYQAFGYDAAGRPDRTSVWFRDGQGPGETGWANPSTVFGHVTTYDSYGRVTSVTDPNGVKTTTSYSGLSRTVTRNGASTVFTQDLKQRLSTVRDALSQTTSYAYDPFDRISTVTQAGAAGTQVRSWGYDGFGRLVRLQQPESGVTRFEDFHVSGKPSTVWYDGDGTTASRKVTTVWDVLGRPESIAAADQSVLRAFTYGAPGGVDKLHTATHNGVTRTLTYFPTHGRLQSLATSIPGAGTFAQAFGYDTFGRRTTASVEDRTVVTGFAPARDLPNAVSHRGTTLVTAAFGGDAGFETDPSWNLRKLTYDASRYTSFGYDADQVRLKSLALYSPSGTFSLNYTYDASGLLRSTGEDWFEYDKLDRLTTAYLRDTLDPTSGKENRGLKQTFTYDAFGNRLSASTVTLTSWLKGTTPSATLATSPTLRAGVNGRVANLTLNANRPELLKNRLPKQTSAGADTGALYDGQGNLTSVFKQVGATLKSLTFTYDALGQVTRLDDGEQKVSESYAYNDEGLRVMVTNLTTGKVVCNIYNDSRQLVSQYELASPNYRSGTKALKVAGGYAGRSLGSGSAGDVLTATAWFKAPAGVSPVVYLNDTLAPASGDNKAFTLGAGDGTWKQVTTTLTLNKAVSQLNLTLGSPSGEVLLDDVEVKKNGATLLTEGFEAGSAAWRSCAASLQEATGASPSWTRDVVYLGTREIAEVASSGKVMIVGTDHLGTPRFLSDGVNPPIEQKFLPFGEALIAPDDFPKIAKGYTNHEQTDASGLIYMQARFYLPMYGRFASPDPARDQHFEETQSWNIYSYVRNNPVMMTDPTGMFSWSDAWNYTKQSAQAFGGYAVGLGKTAVGVVKGVATAVAHPVQTAKGIGNAVAHPVQTAKSISGAVSNAWNNASTPQQMGEFIGRAAGEAALIVAPFAKGGQAANLGKLDVVANPVSDTLARVVPGNLSPTMLGAPGVVDVFVTNASGIRGLSAAQIADRLTIPGSPSGFKIFEFPSAGIDGIASPINRTNPGFIGGGKTAGGASEFVIPNGPIPKKVVETLVK